MNIELEANEVQFILDRLGDLPSRSGCFPLIVKIQSQAQAQTELPKDEAA
jgi:hypothetical protein|tara:strand:+ start:349 stop:498 length:150 start_codon:yes stop_codon:yes gene_type:complete